MLNNEIVSQLDSSAIVIVRLLVTFFLIIVSILAFIFALFLTAFVASWILVRGIVVFVMTCKQANAAFSFGGRL